MGGDTIFRVTIKWSTIEVCLRFITLYGYIVGWVKDNFLYPFQSAIYIYVAKSNRWLLCVMLYSNFLSIFLLNIWIFFTNIIITHRIYTVKTLKWMRLNSQSSFFLIENKKQRKVPLTVNVVYIWLWRKIQKQIFAKQIDFYVRNSDKIC